MRPGWTQEIAQGFGLSFSFIVHKVPELVNTRVLQVALSGKRDVVSTARIIFRNTHPPVAISYRPVSFSILVVLRFWLL